MTSFYIPTPIPTGRIFVPQTIEGNDELENYSKEVVTNVYSCSSSSKEPTPLSQLNRRSDREEVHDSICYELKNISKEFDSFIYSYMESCPFTASTRSEYLEKLCMEFIDVVYKSSITKSFILSKACELSTKIKEGKITKDDLIDDEFYPFSPFSVYRLFNYLIKAIALIYEDCFRFREDILDEFKGCILRKKNNLNSIFDPDYNLKSTWKSVYYTKIKKPSYHISFNAEFLAGENSEKLRLKDFISTVSETKHEKELFAALIAVCQSSGSGKTKLCCEMSEYYSLAYINFRDPSHNSSTFPYSFSISSVFEHCYGSIKLFLAFIAEILKNYVIHHVEDGETTTEICSLFLNGGFKVSFDKRGEKAYYQDDYVAIIDELVAKISPDRPFVFVFDGYAKLHVENKKILMMAFNALRESNIVFIVLGNSTEILNLELSNVRPINSPKHKKFLPPYIISSNFDVLSSKCKELGVLKKENFRNEGMVFYLISLGRPMWSSLDVTLAFAIAYHKLENNSIENGFTFAACWMIRTGIPANAFDREFNKYLVKSLMGTLHSFSPVLDIMTVTYPSEPCVALGAHSIVKSYSFTYFRTLKLFLKRGSFQTGRLSEHVSMEYILRAISNANPIKLDPYNEDVIPLKKPRNFLLEDFVKIGEHEILDEPYFNCRDYKITTVNDFITSLYEEALSEIDDEVLLSGYVNCTHFVNIFNVNETGDSTNDTKILIDQHLLASGFSRQCGFIMPSGYSGIGYIIPICLDDGLYSFISVQAESSSSNIVSCMEKMAVSEHYQRPYHKSHLALIMPMDITEFDACDSSIVVPEKSNYFDSVIAETSTTSKFALTIAIAKKGKDEDEEILYCIRSTNIFNFDHLLKDDADKIKDVISVLKFKRC